MHIVFSVMIIPVPVSNCSVWEGSGSDDRLRVTRDAWSFFSAGVRGTCDGFFITCVILVVRLRMKARIASGGCRHMISATTGTRKGFGFL